MGDEERSRRAVNGAKGMTENSDGKSTKTDERGAAHAIIPKDCRIAVVCLPARDEADEIAGIMLAQLLELRGYCAMPVSRTSLASEMLSEVEKHNADVVVVSALPPAAVAHARYLCKRLQAENAERNTIVALWT